MDGRLKCHARLGQSPRRDGRPPRTGRVSGRRGRPSPRGGTTLDTEADLARIEATRETFPDLRKQVVSRVIDGNEAAVQYRWSGTHEGEFAGVPATGKPVETPSLTLLRLSDDRLSELYIYGDSADLMNQLSE